jgi:hypothetical protein
MSHDAIAPRVRAWFQGAEGTRAFHSLCRLAEHIGPGGYEMALTDLQTGERITCALIVPMETGIAEISMSPHPEE